MEDKGNAMASTKLTSVHLKFRTLILSEQGENQFTYSGPLKIDKVYSEVHLASINGCKYLLGKNSENVFREIQKKQRILLTESLIKYHTSTYTSGKVEGRNC